MRFFSNSELQYLHTKCQFYTNNKEQILSCYFYITTLYDNFVSISIFFNYTQKIHKNIILKQIIKNKINYKMQGLCGET